MCTGEIGVMNYIAECHYTPCRSLRTKIAGKLCKMKKPDVVRKALTLC